MSPTEPNRPSQPAPLPALVAAPLAERTRSCRRPVTVGVSALTLAATLVLLLSSCGSSSPQSTALASGSATAGIGPTQTPGAATTPGAPPIATPPHVTPVLAQPSVHEVAHTATLSGTSTGPVTATCPAGEIALGGGWSVPQTAHVFSAIVDGSSWTVNVTHPAPTALRSVVQAGRAASRSLARTDNMVELSVTAYVECLAYAPGAVVTRRATTVNMNPTPASDSDDQLGGLTAVCNQNEVPVGFGFDFTASSTYLEVESNWPRSDVLPIPLWVFTVRNYDAVSHPFTQFVECLSNIRVSPSFPRQDGSQITTGATATATVSCPAGAVVAGGGFRYTRHDTGNQYLGNPYLLHSTASGWRSDVYVATGYGLYALVSTAVAVCLSFA